MDCITINFPSSTHGPLIDGKSAKNGVGSYTDYRNDKDLFVTFPQKRGVGSYEASWADVYGIPVKHDPPTYLFFLSLFCAACITVKCIHQCSTQWEKFMILQYQYMKICVFKACYEDRKFALSKTRHFQKMGVISSDTTVYMRLRKVECISCHICQLYLKNQHELSDHYHLP